MYTNSVSYSFLTSGEQVFVVRVSSLSITTRTRRPGPLVFPLLVPRPDVRTGQGENTYLTV